MSNPGLRLEVADPHAAHRFNGEEIQFIGIGAAAGPGYAFAAIDGETLTVLLNERVVSGLFNQSSDLIDGIIPGDIFPTARAGPAHLRLGHAWIIEHVLLERGALWAGRCTVNPPV